MIITIKIAKERKSLTIALLPEQSPKKISDYLIFLFRDIRKKTRKN